MAGNLATAERVETQGSWWYFDADNAVYLRSPKEEKPRENGWGGPEAGSLQDLVWHPYERFEFGGPNGRRLYIWTGVTAPNGDVEVISAPLTTAECERRGLL